MNPAKHGMSGQSVADRLTAAKHSIAGHGLAKTVCKATTEEVMGPKKKHVDYLVACTDEPNVSIPTMANLLIERTQHQNWVVVFKALITVHNVMNYGNERFTQFLASNNCQFNLGTFRDKTGVQGYDMSTFIRRYAKYLNEKAYSYRQMAFDFCKVKRGKDDGLLRTMNADKLLKTLPVLQQQLDALLEFDCTPNELTNGVINACFMLMFKDLIRLFACYNDGIINLLEKFFEMNRKQCKEGLDIYKKFLVRMERVSEFLKVAENVGIDKGDIPDLAKAPSSLLEALEEHLKAMEGKKATSTNGAISFRPAPAPASVTTAINSLSGIPDPSSISDEEKRRILEEENKAMEALKQKKDSTNPFMTSPTTETSGGLDLLGAGSPTQASGNDLLGLAGPGPADSATNPFAAMSSAPASSSPWNQPTSTVAPTQQNNATGNGFTNESTFAAVFGSSGAVDSSTTGFDGFGEVLRPQTQVAPGTGTPPTVTGPVPKRKDETKLIKGDVDSSLQALVGNLGINGPGSQIKKTDHQWNPAAEKKLTGAANAGWAGSAPPTGAYNAPGGYNAPVPTMSSLPNIHMLNNMSMSPSMGSPMMGSPGYMQPTWVRMANGYTVPVMGGGGVGMMGQPAQAGMMPGYQQPMMGQSRPMGMQQQQPGMMGTQQQQQPKPQSNDPFASLL